VLAVIGCYFGRYADFNVPEVLTLFLKFVANHHELDAASKSQFLSLL